MHRKPVNHRFCPNPECSLHGQLGKGNVVRHGFIRLKRGRRRRYRCTVCGRTFCSTVGTPYYRLQCTRKTFDEVALMGANEVSKSAIARIKGISWNTVARWVEGAAEAERKFNHLMTQDYPLRELQTDEIKTFVPEKNHPLWVSTAIDVLSRLWTSTVLGRRSCGNARRLISDTTRRGVFSPIPPFRSPALLLPRGDRAQAGIPAPHGKPIHSSRRMNLTNRPLCVIVIVNLSLAADCLRAPENRPRRA